MASSTSLPTTTPLNFSGRASTRKAQFVGVGHQFCLLARGCRLPDRSIDGVALHPIAQRIQQTAAPARQNPHQTPNYVGTRALSSPTRKMASGAEQGGVQERSQSRCPIRAGRRILVESLA